MPNWRQFMIEWNVKFPLDRNYRQKHSISFNSPQHRELNQVDIYLQWLEDSIYQEFTERAKEEIEKQKMLEEGVWIRDSTVSQDEDILFDKIDISKFNNSSSQLQIEE